MEAASFIVATTGRRQSLLHRQFRNDEERGLKITSLMRITSLRSKMGVVLAIGTAALTAPIGAFAQSGTWITDTGGSWTDSTNWQDDMIASGSDSTADFSTLYLGSDSIVTLDGPRTIGHLIFGDLRGSHNWLLDTGSVGPLTLAVATGSPSIDVNNQATTVSAALAGTQGLTKLGAGTLSLTGSNTYSGLTAINGGELDISPSQLGGGPVIVGDGAALGVFNFADFNVDMSDLSLSNSTLNFDFGNVLSLGTPIATSSLEVNGGTNSVTINITIDPAAEAVIGGGHVQLIQYASGRIGGSGAGFGAFHLGRLPPYWKASLSNDTKNHSIDLDMTPEVLVSSVQVNNGVFKMSLQGVSFFTVRATTNLALPLSEWQVVGTVNPGVTVFNDPASANFGQRFYLITP
ncbi:MAG: autotransporter-associated beta strand repeat-containing protein [Limisphaerales bacterium]